MRITSSMKYRVPILCVGSMLFILKKSWKMYLFIWKMASHILMQIKQFALLIKIYSFLIILVISKEICSVRFDGIEEADAFFSWNSFYVSIHCTSAVFCKLRDWLIPFWRHKTIHWWLNLPSSSKYLFQRSISNNEWAHKKKENVWEIISLQPCQLFLRFCIYDWRKLVLR